MCVRQTLIYGKPDKDPGILLLSRYSPKKNVSTGMIRSQLKRLRYIDYDAEVRCSIRALLTLNHVPDSQEDDLDIKG